jgi:hypothetical protein
MQPKKCDITGTVEISITRPTTGRTLEMFSVTRPDGTADVTSLTGIGRIHENERDSGLKSFVAQELSELIESPAVNPSPLVLPGLLVNILADTRKVFQSYLSRDLLSSGHNGFADFMVDLSMVSALLSRQPFLKLSAPSPRASSAFRSFLLENSTHRLIVFLNLFNRLAAKLLAFRGNGDIRGAKIHSDHFVGLDLLRSFAFGLDIDVILRSFLTKRCTCGLGVSEPVSLKITEDKLNSLPGSEKGETNRFIFLPEGKDPGVIVDAGRFEVLDGRMVFQSGLAVTRNPVDGSDSEISRETELRPDILVNHVVNFNAVSHYIRHSPIDPVTSISERLQGILYLGDLFRRRSQLTYCGQDKFSHLEVSYMIKSCIKIVSVSVPNSSPPLKGRYLLGDFL